MTFQKLIVNAVDIIDGMDALSIRKIFVRLAVRFIVMDGIKHFIEVLFRMPPVVEQLIIEPQDLRSPKAGGLRVVLAMCSSSLSRVSVWHCCIVSSRAITSAFRRRPTKWMMADHGLILMGETSMSESSTKTIPPPLQNNSFRFTSHPPQ